jgi:hypothetical protein
MKKEPGTYRGLLVEKAVGSTKPKVDDNGNVIHNGLPQLVVRIQPEEVYDFEDREWYAVDQTNLLPDIGYLVLCSPTQEMFHLADVRETLGWSGTTFKSLAELDIAGMKVQYRMAENEWEGKVTIQMQGIRPYDAAPTGGLRAASDDDIKKMDAEFGGFLKNSAAKAKASTPKTTPKPPRPPKTPRAKEPEVNPLPPEPQKPKTPKTLPTTPPGSSTAADAESPVVGPIDQKCLDELPTVSTEEECWAVISEQAEKYEADSGNVLQWWEDYKKLYPNDWDTLKTELMKDMLKTYGIPF